jgi:hypothetical protein
MCPTGDDPEDLRIAGIGKAGAAAPSEALDGVSSTQDVAGAAAVEQVSGSSDVAHIAAALSAGTMDPAAAKAELIERAVAAQLPPEAPPELVAEVRAEVAALLDADPVLGQLLRP